ncbi:MAG: hypothetical protein KKB57_06775, partial [Proteobacteria bacterium]|nr:hypothetical protein [Pseudomonadota bacterium]
GSSATGTSSASTPASSENPGWAAGSLVSRSLCLQPFRWFFTSLTVCYVMTDGFACFYFVPM